MCVDAVVRRMVATGNDSYPFCGPIVRNCILAGLHGDHLHGDHLHSDHLHGLMASRRWCPMHGVTTQRTRPAQASWLYSVAAYNCASIQS